MVTKETCVDHITLWVCSVVLDTYVMAEGVALPQDTYCVHEKHALASTWYVFGCPCFIAELMMAAFCHSSHLLPHLFAGSQ